MGSQYFISQDAIALGAATAKSILELGTTAGVRVKVTEWWVEFDGTNASAVPGKVEVGRFTAAVTTASTITPSKYDVGDGASSLAAGPTSKVNTSAEGAGTATDVFIHRVPPTGGLYIQYPLGRELVLAVSTFFRIRCTFAAAVNVSFGISWEE